MDPNLHYGRFKILQRVDGLYVVHEKDQRGSPFRFGPVFESMAAAQWRAWHRATGEAAAQVEIGDQVTLHGVDARPARGLLGFVVDFVASLGELRVARIEIAVRVGSRIGMYPIGAVSRVGGARASREASGPSEPWKSQYS